MHGVVCWTKVGADQSQSNTLHADMGILYGVDMDILYGGRLKFFTSMLTDMRSLTMSYSCLLGRNEWAHLKHCRWWRYVGYHT